MAKSKIFKVEPLLLEQTVVKKCDNILQANVHELEHRTCTKILYRNNQITVPRYWRHAGRISVEAFISCSIYDTKSS